MPVWVWVLFGLVGVAALLVVINKTDHRRRQERMRQKLAPGVRFAASGATGMLLKGKCVQVIDRHTIEALVGPEGQPLERGPFPIDRILWLEQTSELPESAEVGFAVKLAQSLALFWLPIGVAWASYFWLWWAPTVVFPAAVLVAILAPRRRPRENDALGWSVAALVGSLTLFPAHLGSWHGWVAGVVVGLVEAAVVGVWVAVKEMTL